MFSPKTRVLIVDDMKTMRLFVKKMLTEFGLKDITEADDGSSAWPLIEASFSAQNPFKLIISDWNMPQMTGIELLKKVRASPNTKDIPFILVTAETEKDQVMEAIKSGVSSYVSKPFTIDTLKEKLEMVHKKLVEKDK